MGKKLIAVLLALCLPVMLLSGCGGGGSAKGFFDILDEIQALEQYQLELVTGEEEALTSGKKISGTVSRSSGQAELTLTAFDKAEGDQGSMSVLVDGKEIYLKLDEWITYLDKAYQGAQSEMEDYKAERSGLRTSGKALGKQYVRIVLPQTAFQILGQNSDAEAAYQKWYTGLREELDNSISEKDGVYTLELEGKALRSYQISRLTNLTENQKAYCGTLKPVLNSAEATLAMIGWDSSGYLDNTWTEYREELEQLENGDKEAEGSVQMTVTKQEDGSYQITLNQQGEETRYLCATITPLKSKPDKLKLPSKFQEEKDVAEALAELYLDSKELPNVGSEEKSKTDSAEKLIDPAFDWDKRYAEEGDDTKDYGTDLALSDVKQYSHIKTMKLGTEDEKCVTLPIITGYEYSEAEKNNNGGAYTVYLSTENAWEGNIYNIQKAGRSPKEILTESMDSYVSIFKEDWGYRITQPVSTVQINQDGTACISGFGYYDEDNQCEVTMLSLVTLVKDSEYVIDYEFSAFGGQVSKDDVTGMQELCSYFGLKMPVTIQTK